MSFKFRKIAVHKWVRAVRCEREQARLQLLADTFRCTGVWQVGLVRHDKHRD